MKLLSSYEDNQGRATKLCPQDARNCTCTGFYCCTGVYATDLCELAEPVAVKHGFWQEHNSKR